MTAPSPPDGFKPHFRKSPFTTPWEPLYSRVSARKVVIGLYLAEPHCNSRGMVHGGLIASLCDNAMGLSCVQAVKDDGREATGMVTVNLSTDYLGTASLGEWMEIDTVFVQAGGSLAFANCIVTSAERTVARASATFRILLPRK